MKDYLLIFILLIGIICVIALVYSIGAGIWSYNPTIINNFNLKLGITSFLLAIAIPYILKEFD